MVVRNVIKLATFMNNNSAFNINAKLPNQVNSQWYAIRKITTR